VNAYCIQFEVVLIDLEAFGAVTGGDGSPGSSEFNGGAYDFTSKLLHLAWHPQANVIACAASNSLYMYYA
jgi:serine/threonine-protein phosphatase 2A regulatory subunit B